MIYAACVLLFQLDAEAAHEWTVEQIGALQQIPIALRAIERSVPAAGVGRATLFGLTFRIADRHRRGIRQERDDDAVPRRARLRLHRGRHGDAAPAAGQSAAAAVPLSASSGRSSTGWVQQRRRRRRRASGCERGIATRPALRERRQEPRRPARSARPRPTSHATGEARAARGCGRSLNLSSPNTPGLRDLQRPEHLERLLRRGPSVRGPVLVKIAPDLDDAQIAEICDVCAQHADGMICTNTTSTAAG